MSVLGYFTSNTIGSSDGYNTPFIVAPLVSYANSLYPKAVPTLFVISIFFTVCTPSILSNKAYILL